MKFKETPFIAIWETTQACDLVCLHCRAAARPTRDCGELSTDEAKNVFDSLAKAKVPLVILTGGDPAKRPDLRELVQYGTSLGLTIGLTPSATPLLTPELLQDLKQVGLARLALSIDGLTAEVHDTFRGRDGSYEKTLAVLRAAKKLGLSTQVNTTLHAGTIHQLPRLADLMTDLGIQLWSVFVMVPTGRASLDMMVGASALDHGLKQLVEISKRVPFAVKSTAGPHYRRLALEEKKLNGIDVVIGARGRQAMWVNEGRGFLFISHLGEVYPSGFLPVSCGNVRKSDPISIYRTHPTFQLLRDSDALVGKCRACEYRHVCGGSRARAYAMTGELMSSDPLCTYVPPGYDGAVDIFEKRQRGVPLPMLG